MEIERKFTVRKLPDNLDSYPFHIIEQAYLNTDPVVPPRGRCFLPDLQRQRHDGKRRVQPSSQQGFLLPSS